MITDEMVEAGWNELGRRCAATPVSSPDFSRVSRLVMVSKDDLRAALEAAERAAWRPISEAPKDGRASLIGNPNFVTLGRWYSDEQEWREINNDPTDHWGIPIYPTHFRPLPTPPKDITE